MLRDLGDLGQPFDAPNLQPCPFCGVTMHRFKEHPSFYHPGVITDTDCVLSGKGFRDDEASAWNARGALSQPGQDDAGLVERLNARTGAMATYQRGEDGRVTRLINPDGPDAARRIAALSAGRGEIETALKAGIEFAEKLTADISSRVYGAEELENVDAFVGIDTGKYDGTWASYFDQMRSALSSSPSGGADND